MSGFDPVNVILVTGDGATRCAHAMRPGVATVISQRIDVGELKGEQDSKKNSGKGAASSLLQGDTSETVRSGFILDEGAVDFEIGTIRWRRVIPLRDHDEVNRGLVPS